MWARASFVVLQVGGGAGGGGWYTTGGDGCMAVVVVVSAAMTLLVKGAMSCHWAELLSGPSKARAGVA
jgi:hypothetical protein